jgi:DNA polymerase-4
LGATDLHCSVGIGDNKVRAKIATGFGKPRGVFRLTRDTWTEVMGDRPTTALWGVGAKVSKRLATHGIVTVRQLADAEESVLVAEFGPRMGVWYGQLGHGNGSAVVDDTPWVARGHSRETTYQQNLTTPAEVAEAVRVLADRVFQDTVAEDRPVTRVTLKVRYAPFFTVTKAKKLPAPTRHRAVVVGAALELAGRLDPDREVRLLGVRAELVMPEEGDPAERTPVRGRL